MSHRSVVAWSFISLLVSAACASSGAGDDGPCTDGTVRCDGNTRQVCMNGAFESVEECPAVCVDGMGCRECEPGTGTCNGDTSHACKPDGSGYYDEYCDPMQGLSCNFETGLCEGACSIANIGTSYIGCDYYPTVTGQLVNPKFQFAVAVSNASNQVATVTVEGGALTMPVTFPVMPGSVQIEYLPWVPELKLCNTDGFLECGAPQGTGALAAGGAYHLRSTQPVTVYQFSPLDYQGNFGAGTEYSYSNDASLLMPTNVWTGSYVAAAWPSWSAGPGPMPSQMAITASKDGTNVTITAKAATQGGGGSQPLQAGVPQTVQLNAGDVLELMSVSGDLTGTTVEADQPVQVVAGHYCTQVPIGYTACDHMEESVFPVETLATRTIVTSPYLPSLGRAREQMTRVIATQPQTTVSFDPVPSGVTSPVMLANVGDFVEVSLRAEDFVVSADRKILVVHYMIGQDAPPAAGTGDPAMTLAVPNEQYRTSYLFHAPTNYEANFVNITAPVGATVLLDGAPVPADAFTPIGASGFAVAKVALDNTGDGNHNAQSGEPFGITVYGYGSYTSYWYPGGLDLRPIPIE